MINQEMMRGRKRTFNLPLCCDDKIDSSVSSDGILLVGGLVQARRAEGNWKRIRGMIRVAVDTEGSWKRDDLWWERENVPWHGFSGRDLTSAESVCMSK
jgi:hypothetical protein